MRTVLTTHIFINSRSQSPKTSSPKPDPSHITNISRLRWYFRVGIVETNLIDSESKRAAQYLHAVRLAITAGPPSITGKSPAAIFSARRLANIRAVDPEGDRGITSVSELCASSDTDFATAADGSAADSKIVAVLDQDSVVAVVGKIHSGDDYATRLTDAEDTTTAATRPDPIDEDVGGVGAACEASVAVGESNGAVARASADVVTIDEADVDIDGVLEQQARLADVTGDDLVDLQAVNVPGLDSVTIILCQLSYRRQLTQPTYLLAPVTRISPILTFD